jgi:elongator complex protein 1
MKRERIKKDKLSSKEVLEYLSWVADAEFLYDVALSTFDLKLAVMVAETTQRDPKEYLPYIETLRNIEDEIDRRVKICLHTKRFEKAISILAEGTEKQVEDALALIKDKRLFAEGLSAFSQNKAALRQVRELYADHLVAQKEYKQAAPYYLINQNHERALDCYKVVANYLENLRLGSWVTSS